MDPHPITFDFPLPRTHTGIALGNGTCGVLVWGKEPDRLHLTVSRNDFWDHQNGGRLWPGGTYEALKKAYQSGDPRDMRKALSPGAEKLWQAGVRPSTLLPGGRFELQLAEGLALERGILDPAQGVLRIEVSGSKATLELILSPSRNVLWIADSGGIVQDISARPAWEWVKDEFVRRDFSPPTPIAEGDESGWIQPCPDDPALCALLRRAEQGLALALTLDEPQAALTHARTLATEAIAGGESGIKAESKAWWQHYWQNVPKVEIPEEWKRFLVYAHWKWGCATNPNAARPAPLQGPWIEEYQFPPWGGDYTLNVNIQQIYTFALTGHNHKHMLPLFDMLESTPFQETMRHNAKMLLGIDDGLLLTHTVNDRGRQCQIGFSPHSALDQAVAAWLGHIYWLYYQHTGDEVFLRERAYPFMRGVMRVYEAMLEERGDGTLWLPVSVSPEYGVTGFGNHRQSGPNASMQLACIHTLLRALTESCRILDLAPDPMWETIRERLPLWSTFGYGDKQRIAIWEGQDLAVCHRHHSHLACVYPFDLTEQMSEEDKEIVAHSIEHWTRMGMGAWSEWCYPWAAMLEIRMGMREAPLVLLDIWRQVFINEGLAAVYLPRFHGVTAHRYADIDKPKETNEIMQLEGTAAGATALIEMLVHTHGGVTKVFPATPARWPETSFADVPQPGGFAVSAVRREGRTESVEVTSQRGGRIVLDVPDRKEMVLEKKGEVSSVAFPIEVEVEPGETITLYTS